MTYIMKGAALVACVLAIGVASAPQSAFAQVDVCKATPPTQQTALTRPIPLGISGGNNNGFIKRRNGSIKGCVTGTLGSMVQDSTNNEYILSNNHVLADVNRAVTGQLIVQPGLADAGCVQSQSNAVATFSNAIKLRFGGHKNFVDAAVAAVDPGQVSPDILFIGPIASSVISAPSIGMPVKKMGRTTCVTSGVISALDAHLQVNYSETAKPHLASFVNQFAVTGSKGNFGGPGDSGSLIVTQEDCPQAVALLFAGTADGSIIFANPISEVLSRLNVSMVGTCTALLASDAPGTDGVAASMGMSRVRSAVQSRRAINQVRLRS
jgi:S1-C subfamily serine protease